MNTRNNFNQGSRAARSLTPALTKIVFLSALALVALQGSLQAQDEPVKYTKPSWYFGAAAGANFNFYRGTTQKLDADLTVPAAFHHGSGVGLYLGGLVEYYKPDTRFGFMFNAGYDSRKGKFEQILTPCNCPADLSTTLSYITVEPSLRFAPFKSNFYLFGGPRVAFNYSSDFTYKQQINPGFPEQVAADDVNGSFSSINKAIVSMQIGAGIDIPLSSEFKHTQTVLSPFVSFQPYFGQDPRSIETWTVTTVRVGAALKFGRGTKIEPEKKETPPEVAAIAAIVKFSVVSPQNIPHERRIRETFPIRNYVFFNLGSTQIPDRYVLLTKDQVAGFKEDRLETLTPKRLTGRTKRQMAVYYNVLNIMGARMQGNPTAVVRLTGASREGKSDALAIANAVKQYLVNVFGINPSRLVVEGRAKPRIASEQKGGTLELGLLREDDRRVSIWSETPSMMQEYQTGPNAPLAPVEIENVDEAPVDSYVAVKVKGAKEAFTSWSLEVKDSKGGIKYFGPYTEENVSIPGKSVLGTEPSGDYKFTMIGQDGVTTIRDTTVHMVLWTTPKDEQGIRYSVMFEFNDAKAVAVYEKYLRDVVTPKIPTGATIIIHGYTDTIGDDGHNLQLSQQRADEVLGILQSSLKNAGRSDVKFESYGFGEDQQLARYGNSLPEERFYNRGVTIDIIPKK